MASSARIEELEKKFNENPRRYFAPLANEYRKAGDLTQAISICRTYVPQQPGHMSGHIVFGQALFEAGELDEARAVFESALLLDPENLIALRHLGDIARARGEIGPARAWYRRVLDADPRNEEIAAQLLSLDGMADAPAPAPVAGVDTHAPEGLGGWHEINPERTLELPAALAETAQRITLGTASWLETEADTVPPASAPAPAAPAPVQNDELLIDAVAESAGTDIDGFYGEGYTASMGDAPPAVDQGLGLEVMEFVPPARRQRDADPVAATDSGDTPAAFVTETMAELYLQQGFREEALEVYRQLLAQSPDDDTLRERVAQLESGSRSSFSAAGGVSDSVIEAATQRRNAPTVRSIRAFFGDLAARRVVTRRADQAAPDEPPVEIEATPVAEAVVDVPVAHENVPPAMMATPPAVVEETAPVPPPVAESLETTAIVVAEPPPATVPPVAAEPESIEPPRAAPRPPELPTGGFGIRAGLYDQGSYAEDAFGTPDLGGGFGESSLAEPEFGGESLTSRRRDEVDQFGLPASGDAESFSFDQTESATTPVTPAAAPPAQPLTGSVNGLFPNAHVTASDEAAAETLSTAFGGDTATPQPPGVRRASTELSLDSVFRESPPPPANATARREAGAFSFDQFFGYDPFANGETAGAANSSKEASNDAPTEHPGPAASGSTEPAAETEQFSSWLSGLKKK